jgi:hypothetical protein
MVVLAVAAAIRAEAERRNALMQSKPTHPGGIPSDYRAEHLVQQSSR